MAKKVKLGRLDCHLSCEVSGFSTVNIWVVNGPTLLVRKTSGTNNLIKMLAPWKKSYDKPSRDITLPTKVHLVKAVVFPLGMCGCESWTIKKAECQRIDAFELLCWRRLLRVPWTARRSKQSILKEVSPEYSLEVLVLKLKLQYFGYLMWITDSLKNTLMLGKIEGRRKTGNWSLVGLTSIILVV